MYAATATLGWIPWFSTDMRSMKEPSSRGVANNITNTTVITCVQLEWWQATR